MIDFKDELMEVGCLSALLVPFGLSFAAEDIVIATEFS
jgi:hypothetical protein